jgi:hypothetical protein
VIDDGTIDNRTDSEHGEHGTYGCLSTNLVFNWGISTRIRGKAVPRCAVPQCRNPRCRGAAMHLYRVFGYSTANISTSRVLREMVQVYKRVPFTETTFEFRMVRFFLLSFSLLSHSFTHIFQLGSFTLCFIVSIHYKVSFNKEAREQTVWLVELLSLFFLITTLVNFCWSCACRLRVIPSQSVQVCFLWNKSNANP